MAERNPIPKLAKAFFRWYCKPQRYEELHGDLEEFFYNRLETEGLHKARLFYWYNVLRCCQPYAWKVPKLMRNSVPLLKSYFKTSVRSMLRNPLSTFINVLGLSVAVGVAMLAFAFTQYVYKKESLHERRDSVYLTTFVADRDGTPKTYGNAPAPLGGLIQENTGYTVARVQKGSVIVKEEEQIFTEQLHFVDPSFLQLLSFPLKWGNPVALEDKNGIILTETMAEKYFGGRHPIGQELQLIFGTGRSQVFTVIGVAFDISPTSSIYFHFLVHFDNLQLAQPALDLNNWQDFLTATLVEAPSAAEATALLKKMDSYRPVQNEAAPDWAVTEFGLEPLASVYLASAEVHTPLVNPGSRENQMSIYFLGTLSVVILLLACFNYLNMAIATAAKRLKEIGVRKAIGAHRARVMAQFLIENILLAGIALALGLVLGLTVTIPGFEFIHSFDMGFTLWDPILGWFLLFTLFLTGIASGLYPALFISRIQVVGIFQKKVKLGQGNRLTKGLLGFQLILSCISITCAVFFTQNADYVGQRAWGYEPKGVLYTPVANGEAYRTLRDALEQKSYVRSVAQAEHHLGKNHRSTVMQQADRPYEVDEMRVGEGYATTMGLRLTDGRWFESDTDPGVVINELLAETLGWNDPVSEFITIQGERLPIVGVVQDFHKYNFDTPLRPTLFRLSREEDSRYLAVSVSPEAAPEAYEELQVLWAESFPEIPFDGEYQEDIWGPYFSEISIHGLFWRMIAVIAMLLAGLGLYGLITVHVSGRLQEFSIRKVLGAEGWHIGQNISRKYLLLFGIALSLGAPASFFMIRFIFEIAYPYHMEVHWLGVTPALILLLGVLLGVVLSQVYKLKKWNPVRGLRLE